MLFNFDFIRFLERKLDCEISDWYSSKIFMVQIVLILNDISLLNDWLVLIGYRYLFLNIGLYGWLILFIIGYDWFNF